MQQCVLSVYTELFIDLFPTLFESNWAFVQPGSIVLQVLHYILLSAGLIIQIVADWHDYKLL